MSPDLTQRGQFEQYAAAVTGSGAQSLYCPSVPQPDIVAMKALTYQPGPQSVSLTQPVRHIEYEVRSALDARPVQPALVHATSAKARVVYG